MSKRNIILVSIGVIALVVLIILGKSRNKDEVEVNVANIEKRTIISTVSANGKIRPEGEVKISADVSGEIIDLPVQEGDTVKEGDLLLKIDPDLYLSALDRARANLNSSQSSYNTNRGSQKYSIYQFRSYSRSGNSAVNRGYQNSQQGSSNQQPRTQSRNFLIVDSTDIFFP